MNIVPSIDVQSGRSRLVLWPGAATGEGSPTDRPERIAEHFVKQGAAMLHVVDLDGAQRGAPANTEVIQRISRAVAVPLQLAGGVDGPEQIELAFACGATRVVVPLWAVAESVETLRACLGIARDWLAIGVDARPDRLAAYPWRSAQPSLDEIVALLATEGVRRLVVSHWTPDSIGSLARLIRGHDLELQLACGATDAAGVDAARASGANALILGEAIFNGSIDFQTVSRGVPISG